MNKKFMIIAFAVINLLTAAAQDNKDFYKFKVNSIEGKEVNLDIYKGSVILIVNTASKCGFTPQYKGLEELYKKYKEKGFVILGFPCNQFLGQEPGTAEQIQQFCTLNYGVTFPMFQKIEVNGENAYPLYRFLKEQLPLEGKNNIRWNFEKFLIDKTGKPVRRYAPKTKPEELEPDIELLLK
jgi:glutathione peroxidase